MISSSKTDFLQAFERATSYGWLHEDEAWELWQIAFSCEKNIIEVGSYHGRSALILGEAVRAAKKGNQLHCIDPFEGFDSDDMSGERAYSAFTHNTQGLPINLHKAKVENVPPFPAEFVYLDGDHTYEGTLRQIDFALACQPRVIAVHDVNDSGGGEDIKRACIEKLGPWKKRTQRLAIWENLSTI